MKPALFLLIFAFPAAGAVSPSGDCPVSYARLSGAAKALSGRVGAVSADAWRGLKAVPENAGAAVVGHAFNYAFDILAGGPAYVALRDRTEEEMSATLASYFFPKAPPYPAGEGKVQKTFWQLNHLSYQLRRNGERYSASPVSGVVNSIDSAFLGPKTLRGPLKLVPLVGASTYGYMKFIDPSISSFEKTKSFDNAANYSLDNSYEFEGLRAKVQGGKETRAEALREVKTEFTTRKKYYEVVDQFFADDPSATLESIAPKFMPLLGNREERAIFFDLRYFYSRAFQMNPAILWPHGKRVPKEADFPALFSLNHLKLYGFDQLPKWLDPKFDPKSLESDPAAREAHEYLLADPEDSFLRDLLLLRRRGKISQAKLEYLALQELELKTRILSLEQLGAQIKGPDGKGVSLEEARADLLKNNELDLEVAKLR